MKFANGRAGRWNPSIRSSSSTLRVIRDEGMVKNKAVYVVLGMNRSGEKDVLGLWIEQSKGAKFWLKVMNDLRNRGVTDILIAVVDGLKGFLEAINNVARLATCQPSERIRL
jgi:putative transposase